jgi:2-keto-4-pentenoate hydratase
LSTNDRAALPQTLGRLLEEARTRRAPVSPLTESHPDLGVAVAYQVQQVGIDLRIGEGAHRVGHKIGLTSAAMQQQLGVDQPDFGVLLDSMILRSGATVARDALIAPRVEAEIAVWLTQPLTGGDVTPEEARAAIGSAVPALEIIDSRIVDWKIALADTVADNASSALAVVGEPAEVGTALADQTVTLLEDGVPVASGEGSALLGDPLTSLCWLVRALDGVGAGLAAGDLVLLGAVHASVPLVAGRSYRAVYSSWGGVECHVSSMS